MNKNLQALQPYPFQRLRALFKDVVPNPALSPINLSIGEPKHETPALIQQALIDNISGLANYPLTTGSLALREAIAAWIGQRYQIPAIDPTNCILPVNGSREALFALAQAVIDTNVDAQPVVIAPNPFYQIYEGAALLAGAEPYFLNNMPDNQFAMDFAQVPESVLARTQLVYVCSPGNPTGKVMTLDQWKVLFELSDRYNFIIAADECYSEIYFDESEPPLGALQAAYQLGRDHQNLIIFSSLSKLSNVPGMRSGFVAGDPAVIKQFTLYRTYHGCAMSPAVQAASIAAWQDEVHVIDNRAQYAAKFASVTPALQALMTVEKPDAAFYLWARTEQDDTALALKLYEEAHITVLPGSYLAREAHGINPGKGFIRIALVAPLAECEEAVLRIQKVLA